MAADHQLQVQHKREVESKEESTMPARLFLPQRTSPTSEALTLVLEMPGVDKGSVEVKVENDVLNIEGRVDFSNYDGLQPLYTEYNSAITRAASDFPARLSRRESAPSSRTAS